MTTDDLRTLVEQQAGQIRELTERLTDVQRRLDEVGTRPTDEELPAPPHRPLLVAGDDATIPHDDGPGADVTGRRELLRRAGVAAAGAAAGSAALVLGTAAPAAAAQGVFDGNPAVTATSTTTEAMDVVTSAGGAYAALNVMNTSGGYGMNTTGGLIGAIGSSAAGIGVDAYTGHSVALRARAGFSDGKAHLILVSPAPDPGMGTPGGLPVPTSRTDAHSFGEIALDRNNDLWLCTASGSPGSWTRLGGASTSGAQVLLNTPVRVYDSRPGNLPNVGSKTKLANGETRAIDTKANSSGVPAGATGVLVNLTVVNTSASGFLAAFKAGASRPDASSINWFTPRRNGIEITPKAAMSSSRRPYISASRKRLRCAT